MTSHDLHLVACTGCRACELVCSFRRTATFDPASSYVRVDANRRGAAAILSFRGECDLCAGLPVPECVKSCWPRALTAEQVTAVVAPAGRGVEP